MPMCCGQVTGVACARDVFSCMRRPAGRPERRGVRALQRATSLPLPGRDTTPYRDPTPASGEPCVYRACARSADPKRSR
jgi:hypothetical protein